MARNGDGLSKRRGIWSFRYRDEAGVWREKSTGETSYAKAREVRREFLDRARDGQLPTAAAELTIEQALANRCEFVEATGAKSSVAPTRAATKHLVRVLGPKRKLSSITIADIRRYQVTRSKEETRGEKTSPKTINNEVLHLVAVLKEAKPWKTLQEDYRPLKVPKRGPGKALTPEDGERLFHIAANETVGRSLSCAAFYLTRRAAGATRSSRSSCATLTSHAKRSTSSATRPRAMLELVM